MPKTALFGGTFDPIHIGHLRIANEALKAFSLDRILFVPSAHPPHKQKLPLTDYEDRFHMVQLACAPYPPFEASRLEASSETTYSIDTLERLQSQLAPGEELYFLIGADAFAEITTWKRWQDVLRLTKFIVVSRPGWDYPIPEGAQVERLDGIEVPVSSSEIRAKLAVGELPSEIPAEVREYIQQHHPYRAQS